MEKKKVRKEQLTLTGERLLILQIFQQSDGQRDLSVYHLVKDGAGSFK